MKSRDPAFASKYDAYVEHPRFGRRPRHTGLNPSPYDPGVELHPNATNAHEVQKRIELVLGERLPFLKPLEEITPRQVARIAGTAVVADPSRQKNPTVPVTHYFDVERICRGCRRPFIFFAEEQRYWFEELGLRLEVDCIRCPGCRKKERGFARKRAEYECLLQLCSRTWQDSLKLVECALTLIEADVFHRRVTERLRAELKKVPAAVRESTECQTLLGRLKKL